MEENRGYFYMALIPEYSFDYHDYGVSWDDGFFLCFHYTIGCAKIRLHDGTKGHACDKQMYWDPTGASCSFVFLLVFRNGDVY